MLRGRITVACRTASLVGIGVPAGPLTGRQGRLPPPDFDRYCSSVGVQAKDTSPYLRQQPLSNKGEVTFLQ